MMYEEVGKVNQQPKSNFYKISPRNVVHYMYRHFQNRKHNGYCNGQSLSITSVHYNRWDHFFVCFGQKIVMDCPLQNCPLQVLQSLGLPLVVSFAFI